MIFILDICFFQRLKQPWKKDWKPKSAYSTLHFPRYDNYLLLCKNQLHGWLPISHFQIFSFIVESKICFSHLFHIKSLFKSIGNISSVGVLPTKRYPIIAYCFITLKTRLILICVSHHEPFTRIILNYIYRNEIFPLILVPGIDFVKRLNSMRKLGGGRGVSM